MEDEAKRAPSALSYTSIVFLFLGFIKTFKPLQPFLTPYLIEEKQFTRDQVYNDIYPIWTYSYFAFLGVTSLLTSFVGYKSMIVLEAMLLLATYILIVFSPVEYSNARIPLLNG
jgi:thiamine transporter 2/3